jgi:transposase
MKEYISFDSHKRYTLAEREEVASGRAVQQRIEHQPGAIRQYLAGAEPGTAVAVEAMGNWYWIVDEIEQAGMRPQLIHPRKAKLMMGMINKTDKLDVHGFNRLQRNKTLPTVWIPPGGLRDLRELTRTRMVLTRQTTRLKNRINAALAKYGHVIGQFSDIFGVKARPVVLRLLGQLPPHTAWTCQLLLSQYDFIHGQVVEHEKRLAGLLEVTPEMRRIITLPGVGLILAAVIVLEIGDIRRFASAERLACYAGTTPRVHGSGGKVRYGQLRSDVNRYLKWAFIEAANAICVHRRRWPDRHVSRLYERLAHRRGHPKAIGAVARHLAEAAFYILTGDQQYRDPEQKSKEGQTRKA